MKKSLLLVCMLFSLIGLKAQISLEGSSLESPTAIELGKEYLFPTSGYCHFSFKSEEDGILTFALSPQNPGISIVKIGEEETRGTLISGEDNTCSQGIKAGINYIFEGYLTWGSEITMSASFTAGKPYIPITLSSINYNDGDVYYTTVEEGNVTFTFNKEANEDNIQAFVILPDGTKESVNEYRADVLYGGSYYYTVLLVDTYKALMSAGKLKIGDTFKVQLENVADVEFAENICGTDGTVSVSLVASKEAITLKSISKPAGSTIKSYYMSGDETGLITFTFSGDIASCGSVKMNYGNPEGTDYGTKDIPFEISGSTIILNLQNIQMNKAALNGLTAFTITITEIKDTEGVFITGNAPGSPGAIQVSYNVSDVAVNVYAMFNPISGNNIDSYDEIEIWIGGGKFMTFDGAQLTYQRNGNTQTLSIPKEKLRIENDPEDEEAILVYVSIKNYTFEKGEVIVKLTNTLGIDGSSPAITATYISEGKAGPVSDLAIEASTPAANSSIDFLENMTITFNKEIGYLPYVVLEPIGATATPIKSADDPKTYTLNFYSSLRLLQGTTYTIAFEAYSSEDAYNYRTEQPEVVTISFEGTSEPEKISDATLVSATPDPNAGEIETSQNIFTYTFSEPVIIKEAFLNLGYGATAPLKSQEVEGNNVILTVNESDMITGNFIDISLTVEDTEGNILEGNVDEYHYYYFAYRIKRAERDIYTFRPISIYPDDKSNLPSLKTFTLTFEENIGQRDDSIILKNANGETVATGSTEYDWAYPTSVDIILNNEITEIGTYTLIISQGAIGNDLYDPYNLSLNEGTCNPELRYTYSVGETGISSILKDITGKVTIYSLQGVAIRTADVSVALKGLEKGIYIVNGKKIVVK